MEEKSNKAWTRVSSPVISIGAAFEQPPARNNQLILRMPDVLPNERRARESRFLEIFSNRSFHG